MSGAGRLDYLQLPAVDVDAVTAHGGTVTSTPVLDGGARWLAQVQDPAGTTIGLVQRAEQARRGGDPGP